MNRLLSSNSEELIQQKITNSTISNESLNSRIFYFGQVINNKDSNNINRIQVRIPVVDDGFYVGNTKEKGDSLLPWCIPNSNRFLNVPEVNSIVMVAIFDIKVPHLGRMYFDSFSDFVNNDYFEKLSPEEILLSNWNLVEDVFGININSKPKDDSFNGKENINYNVGIRGKGNNRILLNKDKIELTQNYGNVDSESSLDIHTDIEIDSSNEVLIVSKQGIDTMYHPVFDEPLFEYLSSVAVMIQKIVTLLNSIPALSEAGPCMPAPNAKSLITELKKVQSKFETFKKEGSSHKIKIN